MTAIKKNETQQHRCPEHDALLIRKRVIYGYPVPGEDYSGVILGGCCVSDDSPEFGYKCPADQSVFYLKNGKLIKDDSD